MKALLVSENDQNLPEIRKILKSSGFDLIHYRSAIKALDNIEEILPDTVFINTADFPRHWKTLTQFIRADHARAETLIILLISERFTTDDADKANFLGINAMIQENFSLEDDEDATLKKLFARYGFEENPQIPNAEISANAVFMFTNPLTDAIITGRIERLSAEHMRFRPDSPASVSDLAAGEILEQCSLKLNKKILSPRCLIQGVSALLQLDFIDLSPENVSEINAFLSVSGQ